MKVSASGRLAIGFGAMAAILALTDFTATHRVGAQDPNAKPTYGEKTLQAGFEPDPFKVPVEAGGPILTKLGGVAAYVAREPDFRLQYQAGKYALKFYVISSSDTTLLINTPDETWIADDDSGGNLNPLIRFGQPKSGQYDIWVGSLQKDKTPAATLFISELK